MEYEEPGESLVTVDTCAAATDVAVEKDRDNTHTFVPVNFHFKRSLWTISMN